MANRDARLLTKRTSVPGKIPTGTTGSESSFIQAGELASNLADHSLWGYDGADVFEYGSNSFFGLTGGTITGDTRVIGSFSADTLFSGSTDVETIIRNLIASDTHTFVQPGSNIITGGTAQYPIVNVVDSPFFNNITISGDTSLQGTTATTLSATTIAVGEYVDFYSGTTGSTDPTPVVGRVYYDYSEKALSYFPETPNMDVTINLGQEGVILAHNGTGSIITNGSACHVQGVNGDGHPTVELAIASGVTTITDTRYQVSGIATHDIAPGEDGFITIYGIVRDLTITGVTEGSDIWLSDTTAGGFTYDLNSLTGSSRVSRLGHVITTGTTTASILVEIDNESALTLLSAKQAEILTQNNASTGLIQGGSISTASTTTFNIALGKGYVSNNLDPLNPLFTIVEWGDFNGITSTYVSDTGETHSYIFIDSTGAVVQEPGSVVLTGQQKREQILVGGLLHTDGSILYAWDRAIPLTNPINQLEDLTTSIGPFSVSGNRVSKITGTLSLEKSLGQSFYFGGNYANNTQNPNLLTTPILSASTFVYAKGTGIIGPSGSTVTSDNYDPSGLGVITPLDANKYTVHRIWHQPTENVLIFQYGQNQYNTLALAKANFSTLEYIAPNVLLKEAYLLAVVILRQGVTNLDDPLTAAVIPQGKFAGTGGGGTNPDTLQTAYDNSTSPEILTDSTRGAVDFRSGVLNSSNVVTFQNTGGTINAFVTGEGNAKFNNLSGTSIFQGSSNINTIYNTIVKFDAHTGNTSNPHAVTASQVGAYTTSQSDALLLTKADLSGATFTGNISAPSISGDTLYSGSTDVETVIRSLITGEDTYITGSTLSADTTLILSRNDGIDVTQDLSIQRAISFNAEEFVLDTATRVTLTPITISVVRFAGIGGADTAGIGFTVPDDYKDGGNFSYIWRSSTTSTTLSAKTNYDMYTGDSTSSGSLVTAAESFSISDTPESTANVFIYSPSYTPTTVLSMGMKIHLTVTRDPADVGDTLNSELDMTDFVFTYNALR